MKTKSKIMTVLDAAAGMFFAKELRAVKATAYETDYPEVTYMQVFNVASDTDPGATEISFFTYDKRGAAKIISNYAKDLPRVDVDGVETVSKVRRLGAAFGYNIDEILAAKMVQRPLDRRRAISAREIVEILINKIAYFGDAAHGLLGLFSHPNIPRINADDPGSGSEFVNKTPTQIRATINLGWRTVFNSTKTVEKPSRLLLPPAQWSYIMDTAMGTDNDITIAQWFVKNSTWLKSVDDIIAVPELEGAGTGGVDVMVYMTRSEQKQTVELPMDIYFDEEEKKGLEYVTNVMAKCGGFISYKPLSMLIMEGV